MAIKKTNGFLIVAILIFLSACNSKQPSQIKKEKTMIPQHLNLVQNSISFFDEHAYSKDNGVYFSEVSSNGTVTSDKVHLVALSRLIYAMEYASRYDSIYTEKALESSKFLLDKMVARDSLGPYFVETYSLDNGIQAQESLGIWQQSYGLCGAAASYRLNKDPESLKKIHGLFDGYLKRFHDEELGGFIDSYSFEKGPFYDVKTLQSILYPMSAAMFYLWDVDVENREKYEPYIKQNVALLLDKGWNSELQWVNLKFDREWNLCGKVGSNPPCHNVVPGHNFQLGWVLLKSSQLPFLSEETKLRCRELGASVIEATVEKNIWDEKISNGFFSEVNPANGEIISKEKTWWQHAEAIIALSFMRETLTNEFEELFDFFKNSFVDFEGGNEHFLLTQKNAPVLEEPKGSMGKSSYHITEMVYYINLNSQ